MAYDRSLDVEVFSESEELEGTKITVSVYSYNEGTPKLQISRQNKNADGEYKYSKLGRMTKEEVQAVLPHIKSALEAME